MVAQVDWTGHSRVHRDRRNPAIHAPAVPLFAGSAVVLAVSLVRGDCVTALVALRPGLIGVPLQAGGQVLEAHAREPFAGAGSAT